MSKINPLLFVFIFIVSLILFSKLLPPSMVILLFFGFYIGFPIYFFRTKLKRQKKDLAKIGVTEYFNIGRYHSGLTLDQSNLSNRNVLAKKSIIFAGKREKDLILFCQAVNENPFMNPESSIHIIEKINYENMNISFVEKEPILNILGKPFCLNISFIDSANKSNSIDIHISKKDQERISNQFKSIFNI